MRWTTYPPRRWSKRHKDGSKSKKLHNDRRYPLQERGSPAIAQMHITERRQGPPIGNTLRNLWLSHRAKGTIGDGHQARVLLAHAHQRCRTYSKDLWSMQKFLPASIKTFGRNTTHPTNLAITKMGDGSDRPIVTFTRGTSSPWSL
jgi:hypothetical protein